MEKAPAHQRFYILFLSLALVFFLIYLDILSGLEVHLTALLLVPVYLATRYSGLGAGILISVLSSLSLLIDPLLERKIYPHLWEVFWNIVVLFIFFAVVSYLSDRLRKESAHNERMAQRDHLTDLLNGRAFFEAAERVRVASIQNGRPFSLCFLDLDEFKKVNDELGHMTGDELLRIVAGAIRGNIREDDMAVRMGGDEFGILFPGAGPEEAQGLVERVREAIRGEMALRGWGVTPSLGVATFYEVPGTVKDMVHHADQLMYRAKTGGKDQVCRGTVGPTPRTAVP
ncbi:MAG TPA: GGDEF domain-containing protein [bacterium]|nr:GGDEF domain-containing protein [bacterium]